MSTDLEISQPETERAETAEGDADGMKTYAAAVANGFYTRDLGGLFGKCDNVRRYWEDQVNCYSLQSFIEPMVQRKRRMLERVRVVDLGCGSGQGYEVLSNLKRKTGSLGTRRSREVDVLPADLLGYYKGIDLSAAMVEQGKTHYADDGKVDFAVGDLSAGLGEVMNDTPYDIYYSSYGSFSHLEDDHLERVIADVCNHLDGRAIFVADLLGRFSYEWPCYWDAPERGQMMNDYSMSYLYPKDMWSRVDIEHFSMRFWGGQEFHDFVSDIAERTGADIARHELWDRSVLVGRHFDTAEFNTSAQPIRSAVNSLHEFNTRTDLEQLLFDYAPHPDFNEMNEFFESYQMAWNAVVYAAIDALDHWDSPDHLKQPAPREFPEAVRNAIETIRNVIRHIRWFRMGDPRANVVEPQLGYILRNLEMDMQQGLGAGHGLLAIYEFTRS